MENLTPPAFGWRRGAGGLAAGVVGRVWQGCGQQGGGVIGAALAVLLVSVCFWLAVLVGGVICCGGGVLVGSSTGPGHH